MDKEEFINSDNTPEPNQYPEDGALVCLPIKLLKLSLNQDY